jgi:hypothetical protein
MSSVDAQVDRTGRTPLLLKLLYGVLLLSALALGLMLLKELIEVFEDGGEPGHKEGLHDLAIFEIAWPIFALSWLFTVVAGVVTLIVGAVRRTRPVLRYSAWALSFCSLSAVVVLIFTE